MHLTNLFVLLAGFGCFFAFSWAVKKHFRSTGAMPLGMKITSLLSLAGFFWFAARVLTGQVTLAWAPVVLMFGLALCVFFWAINASRKTPPTLAFDDDRPSFLLNHGPYQYVRHPFYLAYMMFWTATAAATPGLLPWLAPLVMFGLYSHAATKEEQKFARSELAAAYASYRVKAGMFLPRPSALLTN